MKKILFIYGYGGSPESKFCTLIREALPADDYAVLCPIYPQEDCAKAHEFLHRFIEDNNINLIIGTSLGGFIALTLQTNVSTIVLNPCMMPSIELPKLKPRPDHPDDIVPSTEMIDTYKAFETQAFNKEAAKKRIVIGMFAENDELLGMKYKDRFIECYDTVRYMPGGHHGNANAIPTIIDAIETSFEQKFEIKNRCDFSSKLMTDQNIENKSDEPRELVTQGFIFNIINGYASVLACKRGKAARSEYGKWCIPGGHIEHGESLEMCVSREVHEETNVEVKSEDWKLYGIISDPNDNPKQIICVNYYVKVNASATSLDCSNKNCPDEISEVKFIPLGELEDYDWAFNKQKIIGMIRDVYKKDV